MPIFPRLNSHLVRGESRCACPGLAMWFRHPCPCSDAGPFSDAGLGAATVLKWTADLAGRCSACPSFNGACPSFNVNFNVSSEGSPLRLSWIAWSLLGLEGPCSACPGLVISSERESAAPVLDWILDWIAVPVQVSLVLWIGLGWITRIKSCASPGLGGVGGSLQRLSRFRSGSCSACPSFC